MKDLAYNLLRGAMILLSAISLCCAVIAAWSWYDEARIDSLLLCFFCFVFVLYLLEDRAMTREIVLNYPDEDYDGEEETEDIEVAYQRDWEASTLYW